MDRLEQLNSFYESMLSAERCRELLQEYAKTIDGFVIYGANQVGIGLKRILQGMSLHVLCFLDEFMEFDELDGLTMSHSIEEIKERYHRACFIIAANVRTSRNIMTTKLYNIFISPAILNQEIVSYCQDSNSLDKNKGVYLQEAYFQITNLCTLKCRGCCTSVSTLPPELKNNYPMELIKRDIESFGRIVAGTTAVYITGGEPLLHPDLAEIIRCIWENVNLGQLILNTNATLIPTEKVLRAMKDCRVIVRASDYGKLSSKHTELLNLLERWDITVFSRPADAFPWVEYEEMYDRGGDGKIQMENCREYGCCNIYRGRLYPCFPMIRQHEQKLYDPKEGGDYVDLEGDLEKAKAALKDLHNRKTPFYGCRFCGLMNKEIKAAVQIE